MRHAPQITLSAGEKSALKHWIHAAKTPVRLLERAQIVWAAAEGKTNELIAREMNCSTVRVGKWRTRFAQLRLAGIEKDAPRPGRPATVREAMATEIVRKTTQEKPKDHTHWSTRVLAKELGVGHMTVQRVWEANQLKPFRVRYFKVSNDKHFAEKVVDVVGLYLNPPEHAIVLSLDEKTQIQALDRTQPTLPLTPGRNGTMTHDYKRNGTTTLFAALHVAEGKVLGTCMPKHRHQEWLKFLRLIDRETPADKELHLIVDNYSTHKHAKVKQWLMRHPRFHIHFTPTSASWLNLVERWFRELTDKRLRRGVFRSVPELVTAIEGFIQTYNADPIAFQWTAKAEQILEKVARAKAVLSKMN